MALLCTPNSSVYQLVLLKLKTKLMKRLFLGFIFFAATCIHVDAQVKFRTFSSIEMLLQIAQQEQKPILVDGYTDWCYWCKVLDRKVFADTSIGNVINQKFIPIKLNMETDSLGLLLARKYSVNGYPNLLILTQHGNLVKQHFGYIEPDIYLVQIQHMLNLIQQDSIIRGYSANFNLTYPDIYNKAFASPLSAREYADSLSYNQFLHQQSNWIEETNYVVLKRFVSKIDDANLSKLIQLKKPVTQMYGYNEFKDFLYEVYGIRLQYALSMGNKPVLDSIITLLENLIVEDLKPFRLHYELQYYKQQKDFPNLVATIDSFYAKRAVFSADAYKLNDMAWYLYENCNDQKLLLRAGQWMEKYVLPFQTNYIYLDTHAALLYKTKQYKSAQNQAKRAIEVGKRENQEIQETAKLLQKIEAAMKKK